MPSSPSAQSQVPVIRPFQIDPNGLGAIADSVNLFRGEVTLPISLISLPGRGGLNASATLVYNSNVARQVDRWNLDAPTGPLGLGWSFAFELIALDSRSTPAPNDDAYFLIAGGASTRLYQNGEIGGELTFELAHYQFWDIRYNPALQRWTIVKEDGNRWTYGGDSSSNAVQYGVKWNGEQGNWSGPSSATNGQAPLATGWNLASVETPWGDRLLFEYESDVLPIGNGLSYTRASRLARVTDPTGQTLEMIYQPKEFNDVRREYQIPHFDPNTPTLIAYQDVIETKYLASIEARQSPDNPSAPRALLQRIVFGYEVVNVSASPTDPDFFKRYLTSATIYTADGLALPSLVFSYYNRLSDRAEGKLVGALRQILYPQGGKVVYDFERTPLSGTTHNIPLSVLGIPRIFFGPDYTVVTYFEGQRRGLEVRIYSWNGEWVEDDASYSFPIEIDLDTLEVSAQPEFFALSFHSEESGPRLFTVLFHKTEGRFGDWTAENGFTTLPIGPGGNQGRVVTGGNFAVAVTSGGQSLAKVWDPPTRTWLDRKNSIRFDSNVQYAIAAHGSVFLLAEADVPRRTVNLSLYYADIVDRDFHQGSLQTTRLDDVLWDVENTPRSFWSPSLNFASMTYATLGGGAAPYKVQVLQWNALFQGLIATTLDLSAEPSSRLPFLQSQASDSVIGNVVNLLRYDGAEWTEGTLANVDSLGDNPSFAFGSDAAIVSSERIAVVNLYNPYQRRWRNPNVPSPPSSIPPTIAGDFLTVGRQVYYRDSTGTLNTIGSLDPNLNPKSLSNRAPLFIAYEDQAGNTHVLPVRNGKFVDDDGANLDLVLPNEKIVANVSGPGTGLVGPSTMVTYTGPNLDDAASLTLRQYVNESLDGPVVVFPITQLSIDDGYDDSGSSSGDARLKRTLYRYDCAHVTVTPDASVTEFAAATAIFGAPPGPAVGSAGCYPLPAKTLFGSTEYRYHNNRAPIDNGFVLTAQAAPAESADYSYVVGMLFDRTDRDADGVDVSRQVNKYFVRKERQPLEGGPRVPLFGAYVKLASVEDTFYERELVEESGSFAAALHSYHFPDPKSHVRYPVVRIGTQLVTAVAVIRPVTYDYSWATGLGILQATINTDSTGADIVLTSLTSYAWEVPDYRELKDAHIYDAIAATVNLAGAEAYELTVITWQLWSGGRTWARRRTFAGRNAALYDPTARPPVRFTNWNNASLPSAKEWRLTSEAVTRLVSGAVSESNSVGTPFATLFDRSQAFQIATFTTATPEEVAYAGFEEYEPLTGWRLASGQPVTSLVVNGDAHTGVQCIRLAPSESEALEIDLTVGAQRYLLSCWIKTAASFGDAPGEAGWVLRANDVDLVTFPLAGTNGGWELRTFAVPEPAAPGPVTLAAYNHKAPGNDLLLDDIFFTPQVSDASALIYHPDLLDLSATVRFDGVTTRSLLDSYRRPAVDIGAVDSVITASATYDTVPFHQPPPGQEFLYPAGDPDSVLQVNPEARSPWANLVQGEAWRNEWSFAPGASWNVAHGVLLHTAATAQPEPITWTPTNGFSDYGVRVSVQLPVADDRPVLPVHPMTISIGSRLSAVWNPSSSWSIVLDGVTTPTPAGLPFQTDWLLAAATDPVSGVTAVFFYADGRQLFARTVSGPISGAVTLVAQDGNVGFHSIAAFREPRMVTIYRDGSGKERQRQQLSGADSFVGATGYDPVGRAAIPTKIARIANHLFGYLTNFITSFDPQSGVMEGLVADAYPEDRGYPYARTDFHRSPRNLARAQGLPGADFAIIQADGADTNPHVLRYEYGTNGTGSPFPPTFPAKQYFVQKTTDPDGGEVWTLQTKRGETVMMLSGPQADGTRQTARIEFDALGQPLRLYAPNHFLPGAAADSFITENEYDFLGQLLSSTAPNVGPTQFVHDLGGRIRFRAATDGTSGDAVTIVYSKYDGLGRVIEQGTFNAVWDRPFLTGKAENDPGYPGPSQPHTVTRSNMYGDGSVATNIGRLVKVILISPDGGEVEETFTYDAAGHVTSVTSLVPSFDSMPRRVGYTFNNLGEVAATHYPDGSSVPAVTQSYDRLGNIVSLGTPASAKDFGSYRYTPSGSLAQATLNPNGATPIARTLAYNSPGWLVSTRATSASATFFGETLTYTSGGYDGAGYYSGRIASTAFEAPDAYAYRFQLDNLGQLQVAENTADPSASLGTTTPLAYDANANLDTLQQGSETRDYQYASGTDQITSVTADGNTLASFTHTEGQVASASRQGIESIEYDRVTALTTRATKDDGDALVFAYDARKSRVLKLRRDRGGAEKAAKLYTRGNQLMPLTEHSRADSSSRNVQYIYGPDGLQGMQLGDARYTVLRDHLGSVRAVVDGGGAVVASFAYLPFGTLIRRGGSDPDVVLYRFNGQEFDPELDLYNYNARLYDPWLGRFYALDPRGEGFSPYVYVDNDPNDLTDPTGEAILLAFLLTLAIGVVVGTIAGAATYAATFQGNFNVGRFFLYAFVGAVAGAIGAAAGYGAGIVASVALNSAGVATSTSITSGIVVGTTTGLVEGAVGGTIGQLGTNLIERRDLAEGLGFAALGGGVFGGIVGGVAGRITAKLHANVTARLDRPRLFTGPEEGALDRAVMPDVRSTTTKFDDALSVQQTLALAEENDVVALVAHGGPRSQTISQFARRPFGVVFRAADFAQFPFEGYGLDLRAICYTGSNGFAQEVADQIDKPLRATTGTVSLPEEPLTGALELSPGSRFVTLYPGRLRNAWISLFGLS